MLKILYVVSTLGPSGPTNQLYGLITHLNRDLYEPMVLTLSPDPENSRLSHFQQAGIAVESLGNGRLSGMLYNRRDIAKVVSRYRPDVIHTQGFRPDGLLSGFASCCPWIATIRNDPKWDYPMKFGKVQGTWMAWRHLRALWLATVAACCSATIASIFQSNYHFQNIRAVANGVDIQKYRPMESSRRQALRQKLGLAEDTKVFLSVSSLIERKDIGTLLRGFQLAGLEKVKLLVLGDGPQRAALESIAQSTFNIEFLGNVTNVHEYLAAGDGLISASLSEGLPNSVLEAMATGLPAVLSDIPSHREVLKADKTLESFLFPTKNEMQLAEALQRMAKADISQISACTRTLVEKNFSSEIMSRKYQNIYAECVEANGGRRGE